MDIESGPRKDLVERLSANFDCQQEIIINSPIYFNKKVRADVIALPRDKELSDFAFAFEVKKKEYFETGEFAAAFKQAHCYLYGMFGKRMIILSFLWSGSDRLVYDSNDRKYCDKARIGQLAQYFKVGVAQRAKDNSANSLELLYGATPIWDTKKGWQNDWRTKILSGEKFGSRRISLAEIFDHVREPENFTPPPA